LFGQKVVKDMDTGHLCSNCGQPTTADGLCSFCKMITFQK
jgi:hypothetical protein